MSPCRSAPRPGQVARIYGWRLFNLRGGKRGKRQSDVESVLQMEREAANGPIPSIVTTRLVESPTPTSRDSSRAADAGHTDRTDNSLVRVVWCGWAGVGANVVWNQWGGQGGQIVRTLLPACAACWMQQQVLQLLPRCAEPPPELCRPHPCACSK